MVSLLFGYLRHPVHIAQGLGEVLERELPGQMVLVDDIPSLVELAVKLRDVVARHWRGITTTGHALSTR